MNHRLRAALLHGIVDVSAWGSVRYTGRQLYYACCRWLPLPSAGPRSAPGATALAGRRWLLSPRPCPASYDDFRAALAAYRARYGEPAGLLPSPLPPLCVAHQYTPDMHDYGLSRALVCQHDEIAHMLRANLFHMEAACAVVSLAGGLPLPVCEMLERTPGATVFFLHDASPAGLALAAHLPDHLHIPEGVAYTVTGLRPLHAMRLRLFAQHAPASEIAALPSALTLPERIWLRAGWQAEVAAIRPAGLLGRLRRIVTGNVSPPRRLLFSLRREREIGFMSWPTG